MLLYHLTSKESLNQILKSKKLLPSSKTKKTAQGEGIYETSPYLFFGTAPDYQSLPILDLASPDRVMIIFNSKILKNRVFYTNEYHRGGIIEGTKKYSTKDTMTQKNAALRKLYRKSFKKAKMLKDPFHVTWLHEVFFRGSISIKHIDRVIRLKDHSKI